MHFSEPYSSVGDMDSASDLKTAQSSSCARSRPLDLSSQLWPLQDSDEGDSPSPAEDLHTAGPPDKTPTPAFEKHSVYDAFCMEAYSGADLCTQASISRSVSVSPQLTPSELCSGGMSTFATSVAEWCCPASRLAKPPQTMQCPSAPSPIAEGSSAISEGSNKVLTYQIRVGQQRTALQLVFDRLSELSFLPMLKDEYTQLMRASTALFDPPIISLTLPAASTSLTEGQLSSRRRKEQRKAYRTRARVQELSLMQVLGAVASSAVHDSSNDQSAALDDESRYEVFDVFMQYRSFWTQLMDAERRLLPSITPRPRSECSGPLTELLMGLDSTDV